MIFKGDELKEAMTSVAKYLVDSDNKIEEKEKKIAVYEHAGLHMVLRKIIGHDQILEKSSECKFKFINCMKNVLSLTMLKHLILIFLVTFSEILSSVITKDTLELWIQCNRACFLLIA